MKFFHLFFSFLTFSIKRELEFRLNLVFFVIFDFLWLALSLIGMILIFTQAGTVAGWTQPQALLLVLVYYVSSSVIKTFFLPGAEELSELVRLGHLDLFLIKPVGLRTLLSFSNMDLDNIVRFVLILWSIPWYLTHLGVSVTVGQWILFTLMVIVSSLSFFGIYFAVAAFSFWLENTFSIGDLFREVLDVAKRPSDIFSGMSKYFLTFVVPIGLIASIPTKVLLGQIGWEIFPWMIGTTGIVFLLTHLFFQFALRHYTSASS